MIPIMHKLFLGALLVLLFTHCTPSEAASKNTTAKQSPNSSGAELLKRQPADLKAALDSIPLEREIHHQDSIHWTQVSQNSHFDEISQDFFAVVKIVQVEDHHTIRLRTRLRKGSNPLTLPFPAISDPVNDLEIPDRFLGKNVIITFFYAAMSEAPSLDPHLKSIQLLGDGPLDSFDFANPVPVWASRPADIRAALDSISVEREHLRDEKKRPCSLRQQDSIQACVEVVYIDSVEEGKSVSLLVPSDSLIYKDLNRVSYQVRRTQTSLQKRIIWSDPEQLDLKPLVHKNLILYTSEHSRQARILLLVDSIHILSDGPLFDSLVLPAWAATQ